MDRALVFGTRDEGSIPPGRTMIKTYLNLISNIPTAWLIIISGILVIIGDYTGKLWSENLRDAWFYFAILTYFLSGLLYIPVLTRENLTTTSVIWSLISILGFLFIGLVIFREKLTTLQVFGLLFGVISLAIFAFDN